MEGSAETLSGGNIEEREISTEMRRRTSTTR